MFSGTMSFLQYANPPPTRGYASVPFGCAEWRRGHINGGENVDVQERKRVIRGASSVFQNKRLLYSGTQIWCYGRWDFPFDVERWAWRNDYDLRVSLIDRMEDRSPKWPEHATHGALVFAQAYQDEGQIWHAISVLEVSSLIACGLWTLLGTDAPDDPGLFGAVIHRLNRLCSGAGQSDRPKADVSLYNPRESD